MMIRTAARLGTVVLGGFLLIVEPAAAAEPPRQLSDLSRPIGAVESGFTADDQWLVFTVDSSIRTVR
ncbi:MAG: hypothetical protein AAFY88_11220, partial [Acidobacteriota bacterium]